MNNFVSLREAHDNAHSIWKYLCEHTCSVKKFGNTIYVGNMSEGKYLLYISDEDAKSMTVECVVNPESTILLTVEKNDYIDKVKSLGKVEDVLATPKLYCEAVNLINLIPLVEGSTWEEKIRYVMEEEEEGQGMDDAAADEDDSSEGDDKESQALGQKGAEEDAKNKQRGDVKFTIYTAPDKQVTNLKEGEKYLKIEYIYVEKKSGIEMDFLIGRPENKGDWQLYVGKRGVVSYDDDPYKSLDTEDLPKAINTAVDKAISLIDEVKKDKDKYVQFYIHR